MIRLSCLIMGHKWRAQPTKGDFPYVTFRPILCTRCGAKL